MSCRVRRFVRPQLIVRDLLFQRCDRRDVFIQGCLIFFAQIPFQVFRILVNLIQQMRFPCGTRRVTRITEVAGIESGTVQLQDIFRFEQLASASLTDSQSFHANSSESGSVTLPSAGALGDVDGDAMRTGGVGSVFPDEDGGARPRTQGKFVATGFVPSYFESLADELRPRDLSRFTNNSSNARG